MKKQILSLSMVAVAAALAFSSCKKDDGGSNSRKDQIVGTWKQTQTGDDDNNNGIWDAAEKKEVASADAITLGFKADGTGTVAQTFMGFPINGTTKWSLKNSDNAIEIIVSAAGSVDTLYYNFLSFSASEISVRDTIKPYTFEVFKKQ